MITTKQIQEWLTLYQQGYNCSRIARLYNCSRGTVRIYLNQLGIDTSHYTLARKYYKNKYTICLYDENDVLIYQFNNIYDMAKTLNKSTNWIKSRLCPKRIHMKLRHKNKWHYIHLLEVSDE